MCDGVRKLYPSPSNPRMEVVITWEYFIQYTGSCGGCGEGLSLQGPPSREATPAASREAPCGACDSNARCMGRRPLLVTRSLRLSASETRLGDVIHIPRHSATSHAQLDASSAFTELHSRPQPHFSTFSRSNPVPKHPISPTRTHTRTRTHSPQTTARAPAGAARLPSLWSHLLWAFYINGITGYLMFGDWPLSGPSV